MKTPLHIPVLKNEVLQHLDINPSGQYLDCTLGAGGHSFGILEKLNSSGLLIGIDSDEHILEPTHTHFSVFKNAHYTLHHSNFYNFPDILNRIKVSKLNGILLDLGLSSMELDDGSRGFSFQRNGPLDMRFDIKNGIPASSFIKKKSLYDIGTIIKEFGEERNYKKISHSIKKYVSRDEMKTTFDLKNSILAVVPSNFANKTLARVFQAIRIAVNNELTILKETLQKTTSYLKKGGRLVVISYHSLEDRIVKQFINYNSKQCICPKEFPICTCNQNPDFKIITKKPLLPTKEEIIVNNKSRSAKMRVAEKL